MKALRCVIEYRVGSSFTLKKEIFDSKMACGYGIPLELINEGETSVGLGLGVEIRSDHPAPKPQDAGASHGPNQGYLRNKKLPYYYSKCTSYDEVSIFPSVLVLVKLFTPSPSNPVIGVQFLEAAAVSIVLSEMLNL